MRGLVRDCLVEMFDRKLIYIFGVVTVLTLGIVLLSGAIDINFEADFEGADMEGMAPFSNMVQTALAKGFAAFLSVMIFLAVLGSAGLLPKMLEKGRAEFFLSKPISRTRLFAAKFMGIYLTNMLMIIIASVIIYGSMSLVHGHFSPTVLLYILGAEAVSFFVWLTITMGAGVLFGSSGAAIMSAFIIWVAQQLLSFHDELKMVVESKVITRIVDGLYYIVPKTSAISDLGVAMALDRTVGGWMPLWSSLMFAVAMILLSLWAFRRKDY